MLRPLSVPSRTRRRAVALLFVLVSGGTGAARAQAPADAGRVLFETHCALCHAAGRDDGHAVGPNLYGVVGRPIGKAAGFRYSKALAGAAGSWDAAALDAFLRAPLAARPGTSMGFRGLPDAADRDTLIRWLARAD